jgi:hypothetical protein
MTSLIRLIDPNARNIYQDFQNRNTAIGGREVQRCIAKDVAGVDVATRLDQNSDAFCMPFGGRTV